MSVLRSYNLNQTEAITDAPAQIIRVFDRGVLIVNAEAGGVASVNGKTGAVVLAAADVGAATAAQGALADTAVQAESLADVATSGDYADLANTPTLGTAAAADTGDFDPAGAAAAAQSAATMAAEGYTDTQLAALDAADVNAVASIVAGTNVTVDNTDPQNPIVSATGTGGGGGVESVSAGNSTIDVGGTATNPTVSANVGTSSGSVAAGDDSRITGAAQKASNLGDLASASSARTNLGLGTSATLDVPAAGDAGTGQVVKGTDSRLTDARTPTTHTHAESDVTGLTTDLAAKAPLASPALTGNPTAPTPTAGDNDTSIATTAFVTNAVAKQKEVLIFALGDETTAITTGLKLTVRMPFAMTLSEVRGSLTTASSSGNPAVNIKESGTSIFSTTLTIDATELTSTTAVTAAVISDASLADDAEMTFFVDTAGTGAKGLKVTLIGTRA